MKTIPTIAVVLLAARIARDARMCAPRWGAHRSITTAIAAVLFAALALAAGARRAEALPKDYCTSQRDCLAGEEVCFTTDVYATAGRCIPGKVFR